MSKAYDIVMSNRQEIVEKLIAQMEKGYTSTRAAWNKAATGRSYNPVSNAVYRGGNRFRLMIAAEENGFTDPRWMTFKQASENHYQIASGAKGVLLEKWIFHKDVPRLDENNMPIIGADGKPVTERVKLDKPIVNYFRVFNGSQIIGLPALEQKVLDEDYYSKTAEVFEKSSKCPILYEQQDRAYYSSAEDKIHLPPKEAFKNNEARLSVLLHEMAHSTGHESRLNRPIRNTFGSIEYAKEELNAELSSVFLENELGIQMDADSEMLKDHSNYVKSWISVLKDNPNELFVACANAEEITNYLMGNYERQLEIFHEMPDTEMKRLADLSSNEPLVEAMKILGYEQIDTGDDKISFRRIDDHMNHGDTQGWTFQYQNWSEVKKSLEEPRLWEPKEVTEKVNHLAKLWDERMGERVEQHDRFVKDHGEFLKSASNMNDARQTVVINAFGGAGAGKTTACLEIAEKLKKAGYITEYVQEYAKELVWEQDWEKLDGSQAHQFEILQEQMRRMDRLYGKVDFIVTDAPVFLNAIYNKELTKDYDKMLVDLYSQYNNFNFIMERDMSKFETEGRMQNLEESIQKDGEIKTLLNEKGLYYGVYNHSTVEKIISNAIISHDRLVQTAEKEIKEQIDTHEKNIQVVEQSLDPVAPDVATMKAEKIFNEEEISKEKQEELDNILKNRSAQNKLDLTNKDYSEIHFSGNLEGIDFSKSRFINCVFENAHLSGNKMNETSFHDCKFSHGYMESVDLSGASFYGVQFEHHEMSNNNLEKAYFSHSVFKHDCVINDNNFLLARICNTKFWNEEKYWQENLNTADIHVGGATTEEFESYRQDVIEHLTEADVHAEPRIRQDLKAHGFKPTKTLVENIKQLEKCEMRSLSIKDVAHFSKTKGYFRDKTTEQRCLDKIVAECKAQELNQEKEVPCSEKFLKQEMMADIEVTQIG